MQLRRIAFQFGSYARVRSGQLDIRSSACLSSNSSLGSRLSAPGSRLSAPGSELSAGSGLGSMARCPVSRQYLITARATGRNNEGSLPASPGVGSGPASRLSTPPPLTPPGAEPPDF